MATGTIKWRNERKGYGFVESDELDVFIHRSQFRFNDVPLQESDAQKCDLLEDAHGPRAANVRRVGAKESAESVGESSHPATATYGSQSSSSSRGIDLSQLEKCIGCEIISVDMIKEVIDDIILLESGDRCRFIDESSSLVDELDDVLVLHDRAAGLYKLVTPYEVLEAQRLRSKY